MFPFLPVLLGLGAVKTGLDMENAHKQNVINEAEVRNRSFTKKDVAAKNAQADIAGPLMQSAMMGGMAEAQARQSEVNPGGFYSPYAAPSYARGYAAMAGGQGPVNIDPYEKYWNGPYGK